MANLRHMGGIFIHMGKSHDPLQTQVNCIVSHIANLKKHLKIWNSRKQVNQHQNLTMINGIMHMG